VADEGGADAGGAAADQHGAALQAGVARVRGSHRAYHSATLPSSWRHTGLCHWWPTLARSAT
jgi:hypothetical protein